MKILIAGGGIGGLTAALCLNKKGFRVRVFESVDEIKPLGVGINLLPHCVRVLTDLGLLEKLERNSVETKELVYANRHGQFFWKEPRGRFAGYKWPQLSIHRGTLHMLLLDEVRKTIGSENLFTGCHLETFEQTSGSVKAVFINKSSGTRVHEETGDLLIGADGINSVVRKILYPQEAGVVYSGNVLYRGTTIMKPYLSRASMAMIGSMKQKMVVYPIGQPDAEGNQLTNWVANVREGDKNQLTVRDWNRQVDADRLLKLYANWTYNWIDVPYMIRHSSGIFEFPMSDRDPLDRWTFGRVTLLGDAAHPMYPIGSNGASQAILDAEALADVVATQHNTDAPLKGYDEARVEATTRVVLQNRKKGPDSIMDLMEERFPDGFREEEIPYDELRDIMEHYKKIAGFDIQTLNAK